MTCNYVTISDFGRGAQVTPQNNPLTYSLVSGLESGFNHTLGMNLLGPNSAQVQKAMAQVCSVKWTPECEYASQDTYRSLPNAVNTVEQCNGPFGSCFGPGIGAQLTKGQQLIANTAGERFLKFMSGNCKRVYQPLDPTVYDSVLIGEWKPEENATVNKCVGIYDVDAKTIDSDVIMNKVLDQPWIALPLLINIYNQRMRTNTMEELRGTRIYGFFMHPDFTKVVNARIYKN